MSDERCISSMRARSSTPRPCCSGIPSVTSRASTIMPAHVARVASPYPMASRNGSSNPTRSISIVMVVLSPPGSTMPSRPTRSSRVRTRRVRAPAFSSALTCSANAPCMARTPIRVWCFSKVRPARARRLPASGSEKLVLRDSGNLQAAHRLAKARRDLGQLLRLVVEGGRRDDRPGPLQGVLGLEDAGTDEHPVDAQLHHQRRVGGGRDSAGGEVDDRESPELLAFGEDFHRGADLLGLADQLGVVHALQLADAGVDGARVAYGLDHVAGAGLAFGPDHRRALGDPASGFAEVAAATDEGH